MLAAELENTFQSLKYNGKWMIFTIAKHLELYKSTYQVMLILAKILITVS